MRFLLILLLIPLAQCRIQYGFGDVDIGDAKTAYVRQFTVDAALAPPSAGQIFAESMQDVVQSQSSLELSSGEDADIVFEGRVSKYNIAPVGVQNNDVAAQNRLVIEVDVIFTNRTNDDKSFQQRFTRFADYPSTSDISEVQDDLIDEIYEQITQDVFNKAFSNW